MSRITSNITIDVVKDTLHILRIALHEPKIDENYNCPRVNKFGRRILTICFLGLLEIFVTLDWLIKTLIKLN